MRIDPTSIHRPSEVNKPAEPSKTPAVEDSRASEDALNPRNHFVRERRRKNRRTQDPARKGRGRRAGEINQQKPAANPYQKTAQLDPVTQGPARLIDIDC